MEKIRSSGGVINKPSMLAIGKGIVMKNKPSLLAAHGGALVFTKSWAASKLKSLVTANVKTLSLLGKPLLKPSFWRLYKRSSASIAYLPS